MVARLVCFRGANGRYSPTIQTTDWQDAREAMAASRLAPCDDRCAGDHLIIYADSRGRVHVVKAETR